MTTSKLKEEKFPAQIYKDTVLADSFEDAKRYFLDAYLEVDFAHAIMLSETEIISKDDLRKLLGALKAIDFERVNEKVYDGSFEDLFFFLQQLITENCGGDIDVAGKLHTARSRNDIDVTIYRLRLRKDLLKLIDATMILRAVLLDLASQHHETLIPEYTHTQPAQPSTLAHFLLAMSENLGRDIKRLRSAFENMNFCPLGAGAITTTGFPINRFRVAELLGFNAPVRNSYGSIASNDYFTECLGAMATLLVNIGKFSQEFLQMASMEFGVIRLPDGYVQGSSIMPQKRNPVAIEHIRALSSKALGQTLGVFTSIHNTPFGDINDVEDDLQPLIYSAVRDTNRAVTLFGGALSTATFNTEILNQRANGNFITVTELADTLVRNEGLAFRVSHKIVGTAVRAALAAGSEITHQILQASANEVLGREVKLSETELEKVLSARNFVAIRKIYGGPAPEETKKSLAEQRNAEIDDNAWIETTNTRLSDAEKTLETLVDANLA
ncbi:MAG: argininosuccinate lyase [Pyrinomonadaceae bacterium]